MLWANSITGLRSLTDGAVYTSGDCDFHIVFLKEFVSFSLVILSQLAFIHTGSVN